MTRKPTTKSPEERRLRKQIRALLQLHQSKEMKEDQVVREFLMLIDDEVRRTRMSIAPVIDMSTLPVMNPRDDVASLISKSMSDAWDKRLTCGGK